MTDSLPNRLLRLMSDGRWHSREELIEESSYRFSAALHVLKNRGHKFEKRHVEKQRYDYRLII
ncbi:MAG: hypothetical protein ACFB4I_06400 [Cyanophyceae cyanobacterium]